MTGAALVLSVVDGRTGVLHLVAVEAAALHRRSGRYPALCGADVVSASLTTAPAQECQDCPPLAQAGPGADLQREPDRARRHRVLWSRRAGRVKWGAQHGGRAVVTTPIRPDMKGRESER